MSAVGRGGEAASLQCGVRATSGTPRSSIRVASSNQFYSVDGHPDGRDVFARALSEMEGGAASACRASFWPSRGDGNRDVQCGPPAGWAGNLHVPAECFYSVDQADEPRSIAAVGSADAVVANGERQIRPVD